MVTRSLPIPETDQIVQEVRNVWTHLVGNGFADL
jgi:hypothetical protein